MSEPTTADYNTPAMPAQGKVQGPMGCPGCGATVTSEDRFCGECGSRLWEPCLQCESMNSVVRRFCGACGDPLAERLQEAVERCEAALESASRMASEGLYVQAIDALAAVPLIEHSELRPYAAKFTRLREAYATKREQATADADRVLEETRELEASGRLREALRAAKQMPPALRGRELRGLHDSLEERVKLAERLRAELTEGIEAKSYGGLLEKAERLRELEPWESEHKRLIAKLQKRQGKHNLKAAKHHLKQASAYLKQCEYRKAENALAQVPLDDLDEKLRDAFRRRREVVWLAHAAARAPYLNPAVLAVVDRLVERQPHDERAKQLADAMRKRLAESQRDRPGRPTPWAKPKKQAEAVVRFEHAGCAALLADGLAKKGYSPGQFLTAFGLALQGIGKAEYAIDLAPPGKGVLGKLASVGSKKPAKSAWGIDVGTHSLKAVKLSIDPDSPEGVRFDDAAMLIHKFSAKAPPAAAAAILLGDEAKKSVIAFAQQNELAGERVVVGLPGAQTLGRFFVAPYLSAAKFAKLVEYETRARIPAEASEVQSAHLAWEVGEEESDGIDQRRVALIAATNQHITARTELLLPFKPNRLVVTTNCLAVANATRFDAAALGIVGDEPYAVVSIGAQSVEVVAPGGGDLWFRGLYGGSAAFDRSLVQQFSMSWSVAEKTRRKLDRAEWMFEIDEALSPEFQKMSEAITRALQQHTQESGREITQVLVGGGAADQFGLLRSLGAAAKEARR